jgi:hypothetical protein
VRTAPCRSERAESSRSIAGLNGLDLSFASGIAAVVICQFRSLDTRVDHAIEGSGFTVGPQATNCFVPGPNEGPVRIKASAVNPLELKIRAGQAALS